MPLGSGRLAGFVARAEVMAFLPAAALPFYWLGGEAGLIAFVAALPLAVLGLRRAVPRAADLPVSDQVIARLDADLADATRSGAQTGCLVLQFDRPRLLCDRHGRARQSGLLAACIARLRGALRPGDLLFALEDGSLAVTLAPGHRLDLESMVRVAARLQMVVQQPIPLADGTAQATCCIGFCHSGQFAAGQFPGASGRTMLDAAQIAVDEATRHGPGAIRGHSADLATARAERDRIRAEFPAAVASGQIRAWFQPQVSTDSGQVSGLEALVRWHHPEQGCLAPGQFLPALAGTDLTELLGSEMLKQSLAALAGWDRAGRFVPQVALNLSPQELRDPQLPERLGWALDAHGLAPARLGIEVLESVIAGDADDIITRNLARLAELGCRIDLDDFGTGNASITSIRAFALNRLKIDRSFVKGIDSDRGQQKLVTAILSLAEQLDLDTLAEGVETRGEHAMLAQLGCGHVQGYVVARPMPAEEVAPWLDRHQAGLNRALCEMRAR
jgi:predicted signal transduction protein with EAL and GGDEF domain